MTIKITERSLYPIIMSILRELSEKYDLSIKSVQEVQIPKRKYPDVIMEMNGYRILIQVKINSFEKLIDDIAKTYTSAKMLGADLLGILFPPEIRQIRPEELEKVGSKLIVLRGLALIPWMSGSLEKIELASLLEQVIRNYLEYRKTKIPVVDYLTIANIARETIEDLAVILRKFIGIKQYTDMALAIIGRFDYYRAMLEDYLSEDEMKIYIADIMAYLLIIQLLFLHIVSRKVYKRDILPKIDNPLSPPKNLIRELLTQLKSSNIVENYYKILGSLPLILEILDKLVPKEPKILLTLAKYIYALYPLRPEYVKEELLGRIYQLGLPPETRKNLGAFFTKPEAAKLLAKLAVEKWSDKVLDPACGSGTLLVEAEKAKLENIQREEELRKLHKIFVEEHIVGIDIMQFAKELTAVNLALQNPYVKVEPKIYVGDGIAKMLFVKEEDNNNFHPLRLVSIEDFIEYSRKEYEKLTLPQEGFDLVIMNPPFTRRERIPLRERKRLIRLLGSLVRGKVGYWAYFFVAADNAIKPYGRLAAVTPEEFFAGAAAESIRRYLLLGEIYDKPSKKYIKKLSREYKLKYVIRSGIEIAFSEQTLYRDYLIVLEKKPMNNSQGNQPLIFVILKKKLEEISDKIDEIVNSIKLFEKSPQNKILTASFEARKISNVELLIGKHIGNLKPLVGLNSIKTQEILLELLETLLTYPTLREIENLGYIKIRDYNPGQYITRGVEEYARRLFMSRYLGRGKISFYIKQVKNNNILFTVGKKSEQVYQLNRKYCLYSLRTPAGVRHMDITNEEEYAIKDPGALSQQILALAGLTELSALKRAAEDLKTAYKDLAGNILLVRRAQLTSPNIYYLAFFSENKIIGPSAPMICVQTDNLEPDYSKLLVLYLNSSISLLQLIGFVVETRGAWVALQGDQVWSHIHVFDFNNVPQDIQKQALKLFSNIGKLNVRSLYERIKRRDQIQMQIDRIALKLLNLDSWIGKLNFVYDAIVSELDAMQKILDVSSSQRKKKRAKMRKNKDNKGKQLTLDMFSSLG